MKCGASYGVVLTPIDDDGWTLIDPTGTIANFPSSDALRASLPASAMMEVEDDTRKSEHSGVRESNGTPEPTTAPPAMTESLAARGWEADDDEEEAQPVSDRDVEMISEAPPPPAGDLTLPPVRPTFRLFAPPPPLPPRVSTAPVLATPPPLPPSSSSDMGLPTPTPPMGSPTVSAPTAERVPSTKMTIRGLGFKEAGEDTEPLVSRVATEKTSEDKLESLEVLEKLDQLESMSSVDKMKAAERLSSPPSQHRSVFPRVKDEDLTPGPKRAKAKPPSLPPPSLPPPSIPPPSLPPPTKPRRVMDSLSERAESASLAAPPPAKRGGWLAAAGVIAAAGLLVLFMQMTKGAGNTANAANAPATNEPALTEPTAHEEAPKPAETVEPEAPSESPDPAATAETAEPAAATPQEEPAAAATKPEPATASTTTTTTAEMAKAPSQEEDSLPTNEILHRAHASLREGDKRRAQQRFRLALAKDGSNAEANTGLGDIARSEGDLAGARDHYQRALNASPSYLPAMLALADVKWDLGERSDAQARYAVIVDRLGDRAPARAKERRAQ